MLCCFNIAVLFGFFLKAGCERCFGGHVQLAEMWRRSCSESFHFSLTCLCDESVGI